MIVLTDGVPNIAIDFDKNYFSDDVIKKTNTSLVNVEKNNISLITMLTGISEPDKNPLPTVNKTYAQIIKEIFGTQEKPTTGKFYYIQDDKIEETITKDIYNDLLPIEKNLTNIKIVDYFPKEIIEFQICICSKIQILEIFQLKLTKLQIQLPGLFQN